MICWQIDVRRNFSRYLDGELDKRAVERIENHLLDCIQCRARLARIRDGHLFVYHLPRLRPERDPWAAIEAAIDSDKTERATRLAFWRNLSFRHTLSFNRRLAAAVAVIALLIAGLIVALDRRESGEMAWPEIAESFDEKEYHEVSIANISTNTKPHVVAEGYVTEVRIDKDGDLTFRLVEDLQQREPFIVCEIIEPIRLEPPSVGSRVRVYGVSRYDDQENHRWHEVHPVLNIETVPR
jgi:hypothetical protein